MQASSLLILPDRSMGPLDLSGISDQRLMEAFIDDLSYSNKQLFQTKDGANKDVCKWSGIKCDGRRKVSQISWISTEEKHLIFDGTMSFTNLPASLKSFAIQVSEPKDKLLLKRLCGFYSSEGRLRRIFGRSDFLQYVRVF